MVRMFVRLCSYDPVSKPRLLVPVIGSRSLLFARLASPGPFALDGTIQVPPAVHVQTQKTEEADWLDDHAVPGGFVLWGASAREVFLEVKPTHLALVGTNEEVREAYRGLRHLLREGLQLYTYTYNSCADARHLRAPASLDAAYLEKYLPVAGPQDDKDPHKDKLRHSLLRYVMDFARDAPSRFLVFPRRVEMSLAHPGQPVSVSVLYGLSQSRGFRKATADLIYALRATRTATAVLETRQVLLRALHSLLGASSVTPDDARCLACSNLCDPEYILRQHPQHKDKPRAPEWHYSTPVWGLPPEQQPLWLLP